jgi:hypothetical protein
VVLVVFDKDKVSYRELLAMFWELHNPTQGMRQGNDIGTQYRSAIYCTSPEQLEQAKASRDAFQAELSKAGFGEITTEIDQAPTVYFAEAYHQQYLAKNPDGYAASAAPACACHPACKVTEHMILFHSPLSPFVRKVMVVLHETGQLERVQLQPVNISPVSGDPQLNQDNPIGKIPALRLDDGTVLHDSRVICEYLDSRHVGNRCCPRRLGALAPADPGLPGRCDHGCRGVVALRKLPAPGRQAAGTAGSRHRATRSAVAWPTWSRSTWRSWPRGSTWRRLAWPVRWVSGPAPA